MSEIGPYRCRACGFVVLVVLVASACAPARSSSPASGGQTSPSAPSRALNIAVQFEPLYVVGKGLRHSGNSQRMTESMFNAGLVYQDERELFHPHLAEALPELNTDTWRVFPDGSMATTYRLKPDLTWHDGTPLSADDWVFSFQVYSNPDLGAATTPPQGLIAEIQAPDARTVVVRWKRPFPDADALDARALPALPRHILAEPFTRIDADAFASHTYWTRDFVGMGPFRLVAWEPGAYIDGAAFAGYVDGRPKIDRIHIVFIADQNTALANFLAEAIDIVFDNFMRYQTTSILEREWSRTNGGVVLRQLTGIRRSEVQLNPERASPQAILDVRVRRAITHATDRDALNEGLIDGQGAPAHTVVFPHVDYFPEVDRTITKYPFDPRRAEQLLNEVGYFRGADGIFVSATAGRFTMQMWALNGTQNEAEVAAHADMLRRLGLQASEYVIPAAQVQDNQVRASFPGLANTSAGRVDQPISQNIPRAESRWQGNNRGSWSNPEFDRIIETWNRTLARAERNALLVQAARMYSEEIPAIPLYYNVEVLPHVSALRGVIAPLTAYNAHLWELR